jgi:hypothetical protein
VVRKDNEVVGLDHVAEVADSLVDREELAVVRAVLLLRRREFTGEESERLPSVVDASLQHRTEGQSGSVSD